MSNLRELLKVRQTLLMGMIGVFDKMGDMAKAAEAAEKSIKKLMDNDNGK